VYDIPGSAGVPDRVALFFGGEVRDALYRFDTGDGVPRLTGYVADPACDRGNAKLQYLFVNGRWFRDRSLAHALQEAYRGLLMAGRYPVGFLFLTVPPDAVDVNVHPTKAEVRFRDQSAVYSLVRGAVKARLLKENLLPQLEVPAERPAFGLTPPSRAATAPLFPDPFSREAEPAEPAAATPPAGGDLPGQPDPPAPPPPVPPVVDIPVPLPGAAAPAAGSAGSASRLNEEPAPFAVPALPPGAALQVHDAYLVLETPEGMVVIDQHALHERILYEQLRRRVREGKLEVQRLLIPEPIDLPPAQAAAVLDAADALAELGLEVTDFGGNTVLLSSYPTLLSRRPPHEILHAVVDHLASNDRPPTKDVLLDHLLATMACKAAVKAGDRLTPEEIAHLLRLRQLAEDSHHCPHGRPTSLVFSRKELDRQFRRI
jgi:DNA mismatch repair protein MutL